MGLTASDEYKLWFMGHNPTLQAQVSIWLHFTNCEAGSLATMIPKLHEAADI